MSERKSRDELARKHYDEFVDLDEQNKDSFSWIAPRFSAFCYGWDAREPEIKELQEKLSVAIKVINELDSMSSLDDRILFSKVILMARDALEKITHNKA